MKSSTVEGFLEWFQQAHRMNRRSGEAGSENGQEPWSVVHQGQYRMLLLVLPLLSMYHHITRLSSTDTDENYISVPCDLHDL